MKTLLTLLCTLLASCGHQGGSNNPASNGSFSKAPQTQNSPGTNKSGSSKNSVTFAEVLPIFKASCSSCHYTGGPVPDWTNYDVAVSRKEALVARVFEKKDMPAGATLPDADRSLIKAWVLGGALPAPTEEGLVQPMARPEQPAVPVAEVQPPTEPSRAMSQLQSCLVCHGADGLGSSPLVPAIAGQSKFYLQTELKNFREHKRQSPIAQAFMWPQTTKLSDSEIVELSDQVSKMPAAKAKVAIDIANASQSIQEGKNIYENGIAANGVMACTSCHGKSAQGIGTFPRLAGQFQTYLKNQLLEFKDGSRKNSIVMKDIAPKMSENEMADVAAYLESL